jgi:CRISPR-associated endoribonuclease Cas6
MNTEQGMLFSAVCILHSLEDSALPATHGHLGHAAFLAMIGAVQPELSQVLHDMPGRKPFTVSPLQGLPRAKDGMCSLRAGSTCWLRVTLLSQELFGAFMERLLTAPRTTIQLGEAGFQIDQVLTTPGSHPWAGYTRVDTLLEQKRTDSRLRLVFASPTAFSLGALGRAKRRMAVLPLPELVWGSLRRSWRQVAGFEIPSSFEVWVRDYVMVRQVRNWRTRIFRFRNSAQVGGSGDIVFEALDNDPNHLRTWNLLAEFAFYAGVGYKTTMGMGQVRCTRS